MPAGAPNARAHLPAKVVRAHKDGVHARQRVDSLSVVHAQRAFGLEHDKDLVVGLGLVLRVASAKVEKVLPGSDRAVPFWRVLARGNCGLGLLHRVDHWHDYSPRARVKRALDVVM